MIAEPDEEGRFSMGGLAPGEYRVIALTREAYLAADPETVRRALAASPKIDVGASAVHTVTLELTELR